MVQRMTLSVIARIAASALLFWAVGKHRYGFYQLVRFLVMGTAAYSAVVACEVLSSRARRAWVWCFVGCAVLFNPFIPIHLDRETWAGVDVAVGLIFLLSLFAFSESPGAQRPEPTTDEPPSGKESEALCAIQGGPLDAPGRVRLKKKPRSVPNSEYR